MKWNQVHGLSHIDLGLSLILKLNQMIRNCDEEREPGQPVATVCELRARLEMKVRAIERVFERVFSFFEKHSHSIEPRR